VNEKHKKAPKGQKHWSGSNFILAKNTYKEGK